MVDRNVNIHPFALWIGKRRHEEIDHIATLGEVFEWMIPVCVLFMNVNGQIIFQDAAFENGIDHLVAAHGAIARANVFDFDVTIG